MNKKIKLSIYNVVQDISFLHDDDSNDMYMVNDMMMIMEMMVAPSSRQMIH